MRLAFVSSIAAVAAAAVLAAPAGAAVDARLGGDFRMVGKLLTSKNFSGQAGDRIVRKYKFRPQCETGICRATFYRQRGDRKFIKSTAYRRDPGIYTSVDKVRTPCTINGRIVGYTRVTTKTRITILEAEAGRATRIRVYLVASAPKTRNCAESRQTARLTGRRL